jgi:coproporphyrinogen III oxidase-like Fe-S oxidoreductase
MLSEKLLTSAFRMIDRKALDLENVDFLPLPAPKTGHEYMLYLHIPFCESLCPYCSFNRFVFNESAARAYFVNLRAEMRLVAELGYHFSSLYLGGGTPTILMDELIQTIDLAKDLFEIKEVSCETNPNQLEPKLAQQLDGRVQRLSVGVQSFDDGLLKKVNRYYRFGSGEDIFKRIQAVEGMFPSLNVDMIFNFPGQTTAMLKHDIDMVSHSGANQTTFYPLMSSPSVSASLKRSVGEVSYVHEAEYYTEISQRMAQDFNLSTAWTFSHKTGGMIDEYIVESEEYVGLGSGAFSYLDGHLFVNTFSLKEYQKAIQAHCSPIIFTKSFGKHNQMRYRMMMDLFGLRLDKKEFQAHFGVPIEMGLPAEMSFLELSGALDHSDPDAIRLTPHGQYLSVVMMREFFSGINMVRDQARQVLSLQEGLAVSGCPAAENPVHIN